MDASFGVVAKNADDPGRMVVDRAAAPRATPGFEGKASRAGFYETPAGESLFETERRLGRRGRSSEEESPTGVRARATASKGRPGGVAPGADGDALCRGKAWRPETRRCGRYDYPAGATADSWTYEALNSLDAFPAELAEAARATLAESGK